MLIIGAHISSAKGYLAMGRHALNLGANTLAFFPRNPRGGRGKEIDGADVTSFRDLAEANDFGPIAAHAAYTMNPCAVDESLRAFTQETMADDLLRMAHTPGNYYNFHPGSHGGQGTEAGVRLIAELLGAILSPKETTTVLLETMPGKGNQVGGRFEDLREILSRVTLSEKMGVCLDICHVWDAGYDLVHNLNGVLTEFDRIVGLHRLRAVHLGDSQGELGSRKDRHARLGEGKIGLDALERIINHAALRGLPFILETPNDDAGWAREIRMMKELYKG